MRTCITILALLLSVVGSFPLAAQAPARTDSVRVTLFPARRGESLEYVEKYLRESNLLNAVGSEMAAQWRLPHPVHLAGAQCSGLRNGPHIIREAGAVQEQTVYVCYEQVDSLFRLSRRATPNVQEQSRAVSFALTWIVFDRLSYTLFRMYEPTDIPIDQFATEAQQPVNRIADHLAILALAGARPGGPLQQLVDWAREGGSPARSLLYPALLTLGEPDAEGRAAAQAQARAINCWLDSEARTTPAGKSCAAEEAVSRVAGEFFPADARAAPAAGNRAAYVFEPAVPAITVHAMDRGPERPPLPDMQQSWGLSVSLDQQGLGCGINAYLTFLPSRERPYGLFEGQWYCPGASAGFDGRMVTDTVPLFFTGTAIHFVVGDCAFSGAVPWDDEVRGSLRCSDAGAAERKNLVSGEWRTTSIGPVPAAAREEWAQASARRNTQRALETGPQHAAARARFQSYDAAADGALRGAELSRCNCHEADHDGDGDVTLEEYVRPRGSVTRTYRLVEVDGDALPYTAPDRSGTLLGARLTLYSTGVVVYRVTGRERGGPDTTAVLTGHYQLEGDQLTLHIHPFSRQTARITGSEFRIKLDDDLPWTLWRRVTASGSR